ncbi:hypothetical protein AWN90_19600 [Nocardia terpenica]|uniref:Uncharacterized protein n=1 Tax=Nocardia terpenica TaxID=455432 RepID=A0A164PHJ2_9NOCA|nr:hypothetical protein AWN90_19600 [Nocardia terpenica]
MTPGNGAAYRISSSDEPPAKGIAVLAVCGHVVGTGRRQDWQPAVSVEFRDLVIAGNTVGGLVCWVYFYPDSVTDGVGPHFTVGGESGRLHAPLGKKIRSQPEDAQRAAADLLYSLATDFLTDHRVAHYRYIEAVRVRDELLDRRSRISLDYEHADAAVDARYRMLLATRGATSS